MNKYTQIFRLRAVHLMAFFIFTYVGVEVTIGGTSGLSFIPTGDVADPLVGWIVTYVINERHGGANSGYISSGFFGGKSRNLPSTTKTLRIGV